MTKHRDSLYTAMENMEMENEELKDSIKRIKFKYEKEIEGLNCELEKKYKKYKEIIYWKDKRNQLQQEENEELREKIERLEEDNKHLKDMAEKMRQEKDRLYNNNIRLVREIKELGGN